MSSIDNIVDSIARSVTRGWVGYCAKSHRYRVLETGAFVSGENYQRIAEAVSLYRAAEQGRMHTRISMLS